MSNRILAEATATVSELRKDPMGVVASGDGFAVAILNREGTVFYCVPAVAYETLMNRLEDAELNALADSRAGQSSRQIKLVDL